MKGRLAIISGLLLALLALSTVQCMDTKVDSSSNKIRALYGRAPAQPYTYALEDPRIEILSALPWLTYASPSQDLEYARRLARIYLPRTKESLLDTTDLIVLEDIDSRVFTTKTLVWFKEAVRDHGLGAVMGGGSQGFGGNPPFVGWGQSPLYEIIPVECPYDARLSKDYLVKFKIVDEDNELAQSLPWERAPLYYPTNLVIPKPGCQLIIVSDDEKETPIYFYWDVGEGRFTGVQNIKGVFGQEFNNWEYFQDTVLNTYYYAVSFPLPPDVAVVHELRGKWDRFYLEKRLLLSLIDFADRFGANMQEVTAGIGEMEETRESSDERYLEGQYVEALERIDAALDEISGLEQLALKLKDRALTWIYIIEWLVVFSTVLVSGFIVWSLMVRRLLYKEIQVTSSRSS
jgi:uncharacterized membrane protein